MATTTPSSDPAFVTFKGGVVVPRPVVKRLLDLEARGATFRLEATGGFVVSPRRILTADDYAFLRAHREDARLCLEYVEHIAQQPL